MPRFPLIFLAFLILSACGNPEDTRPGCPVATRQQAFKNILKNFEPMGIQLRNNAYQPKTFLKLAQELDRQKEEPWAHFGQDTQYPPSRSTDAVWERPEDFAKERAAFLSAVTELLLTAQAEAEDKTPTEKRDTTQIKTAYQKVQNACRNCHKPFKK